MALLAGIEPAANQVWRLSHCHNSGACIQCATEVASMSRGFGGNFKEFFTGHFRYVLIVYHRKEGVVKGHLFTLDTGDEVHQFPIAYEDCQDCGGRTYLSIEQNDGAPESGWYMLARICEDCGFAGDEAIADLYVETIRALEKVH